MTDETIAYEGDLTDFTPDSNNSNLGTQRGQKLIQDSIREDGLGRGIVVDVHGNVVAGNKSLENAVDIGLTKAIVVDTEGDTLVVTRRTDWDLYEDESPRRYAWRDNKSAIESIDFDPEAIAKDLAAGVDLSGVFSEGELQGMLDGLEGPTEPGEPDLSKTDELQEKWQVKAGDVWGLGRHKIACGDCTDRQVVEGVMGGEKADMVFADPPYNLASETSLFAKNEPGHYRSTKGIAKSDWDNNFNISSFLEILPLAMSNNCSVYICTSHFLIGEIWDWMRQVAKFYSYCVWVKPNPSPSLSKRQWTWATELIAYAVIGKHTFNYPDGTHALNWWEITVPRHTTEHPTEKPIAVPEQAIIRSSARDDIIFDPFLGSGTTLIAAHQLGRICYGIELDPSYVAVTLQRYQDLTSEEPVLIDTVGQGDTYDR